MRHAGLISACLVSALSLLASATGAHGFIIQNFTTPWTSTASGQRTANGEPATLTWGLVPDGTILNDGSTTLAGSDLIAHFNAAFNGDPLQTDLTQQPWFTYFDQAFARWNAVSGLTYKYEPNDPGLDFASAPGELNVRADIRIGGVSVDGLDNTLAFNFFPDNSDMVLDTDDMPDFTDPADGFVALRNIIMHEAGHGLGFLHIESDTDDLLMGPTLNTNFDGPQLDDIRAAHFYYGDALEKSNAGLGNNTPAHAHPLGTVPDGTTVSIGVDADIPDQAVGPNDTDFVSVSNNTDTDFYRFTITEPSDIDLSLTPLGGQFTQAGEFGTPTPFDADARADLALTLWDSDGLTPLMTIDAVPAGSIESVLDFPLATGDYYASVTTTSDTVQLYRLDITSAATAQTLPGDLDGDGFVGIDDLNLVLSNWNQSVPPANSLADTSGDGFVGIDDLNEVLANWNAGTPPSTATVPEPSGLAVLMCGGVASALSRKR